jgi:hypothetical protein
LGYEIKKHQKGASTVVDKKKKNKKSSYQNSDSEENANELIEGMEGS